MFLCSDGMFIVRAEQLKYLMGFALEKCPRRTREARDRNRPLCALMPHLMVPQSIYICIAYYMMTDTFLDAMCQTPRLALPLVRFSILALFSFADHCRDDECPIHTPKYGTIQFVS